MTPAAFAWGVFVTCFSFRESGRAIILPRAVDDGGCVPASAQPCLGSQALQDSRQCNVQARGFGNELLRVLLNSSNPWA